LHFCQEGDGKAVCGLKTCYISIPKPPNGLRQSPRRGSFPARGPQPSRPKADSCPLGEYVRVPVGEGQKRSVRPA
jgi:hypothetical protein